MTARVSGIPTRRSAGRPWSYRERNVDPETDRPGARRWWNGRSRSTAVALRSDWVERCGPDDMTERVIRSIADYGPLTDFLARSDVEEVFIEGPRVTFIDGEGRLQGLKEPTTLEENRQVVDRLLAGSDRRLDASQPIVQARVMDDSARLTAVIPPIADRLSVTLRRYALRRQDLESLVQLGSLTPQAARFLAAAMQTECGVVVSGPPGAGKTSMLSALLDACPPTRCIRCCEEVRELHIPLVHGSFYEARPPGLDGTGEISLRVLVKAVLAMRPDLIVVGEVRGAEAFELTRAANAGCGFACTCTQFGGRRAARPGQRRPHGRRKRERSSGSKGVRLCHRCDHPSRPGALGEGSVWPAAAGERDHFGAPAARDPLRAGAVLQATAGRADDLERGTVARHAE